MPFSVYAPGKLVLLGEYAVLEGAPSIVAAVDRHVRVNIRPQNRFSSLTMPHFGVDALPLNGNGSINASSIGDDHPHALQIRMTLAVVNSFYGAIDFGRANPPSMDLTIDAREFFARDGSKYGFGSSAAVTVALLAALQAHLMSRIPAPHALFKRALAIHRSQQGHRGSGIDVAASVFGGFLEFCLQGVAGSTSPSVRPVESPPGLNITAVWTGKTASTFKFLADLENYKQRHAKKYRSFMSRLTDISRRGTQTFVQGDASAFRNAVDRFYRHLLDFADASGLPFVTSDHVQLAQIAHEHGGSYKPSGAGGGDIGLVFTDSDSALVQMTQEIVGAGYNLFDLRWGAGGVTL
jgi:mevalonate kinase